MNESKLYQKISELIELDNEAVNAVFEVLDEAKKDIKIIKKKHMFSAASSGATNYGQYITDAFNEWFKKYFGE